MLKEILLYLPLLAKLPAYDDVLALPDPNAMIPGTDNRMALFARTNFRDDRRIFVIRQGIAGPIMSSTLLSQTAKTYH
jgi:hypothetical protein